MKQIFIYQILTPIIHSTEATFINCLILISYLVAYNWIDIKLEDKSKDNEIVRLPSSPLFLPTAVEMITTRYPIYIKKTFSHCFYYKNKYENNSIGLS